MGILADRPPIVEAYDIPEEHAAGLAYVETLSDGGMRFVFYAEKRGERVAKLALTMAAEQVLRGLRVTAEELGFELVLMTTTRKH